MGKNSQIDYLAALAYPQGGEPCREVVLRHQAFLVWARQHLPPDRLLWVMYDGTQAVCWRLAGKAEDWLAICHELMAAVPPSPENRYDRFIYLRTATAVLNGLGRLQEALAMARQIHLLCEEDTHWERACEVWTNAHASAISLYHSAGDSSEVRRIGSAAAAFLQAHEHSYPLLTQEQALGLATAYDNLGANLFFAGQYDLAIPLEQRALELGTSWGGNGYVDWTCLRLAAATWVTTRDRVKVIELLEQGAAVCRGEKLDLQSYSEFADLADDPIVQLAAKHP